MNNFELVDVTISNFRSIRGSVTIPLDADVVLVHGLNGAGKTSFMSAIELALTGALSSFNRIGESADNYLLHEGAGSGFVELTQVAGPASRFDIALNRFEGSPLLQVEDAQYFNERAYLAQATLGRLLDMYQASDKKGASLLTKFVNDLLSIDRLDALVDGLERSGNVTWSRKLVPQFEELSRERTELSAASRASREETNRLESALRILEAQIRPLVTEVGVELTPVTLDTVDRLLLLEQTLRNQLSRLRTDADVLVGQLDLSVAASDHRQLLDQARSEATLSSNALREWREKEFPTLLALDEIARVEHPNLPSPAADPARWLELLESFTRERLESMRESEALTKSLQADFARLDSERQVALVAIANLTLQIDAASSNSPAGSLAILLQQAIPLIEGETCPICGRDFSEISPQGLVEHAREIASRLVQDADELERVLETRESLSRNAAEFSLQIAAIEPLLEKAHDNAATPEQIASNSTIMQTAVSLAPAVNRGDQLLHESTLAAEKLLRLDAADQRASVVQSRALELDSQLSSLVPGRLKSSVELSATSLANELEVLLQESESRIVSLNELIRVLAAALEIENTLKEKATQSKALAARISSATIRLARADARVKAARALANASAAARTVITGAVFNEGLNKTWRDLFVRLAPGEPFVPRFELVGQGKKTSVELRAMHKNGTRGGSPASILSSGNLNTAALTLFLSLNLTAHPVLPWLLLDDPVQSMDDIHISQLATLIKELRNTAKRRIVLAVHERALFDYLTLELSPASPYQSLVTAELSRGQSGDTIARINRVTWEQDTAIAS